MVRVNGSPNRIQQATSTQQASSTQQIGQGVRGASGKVELQGQLGVSSQALKPFGGALGDVATMLADATRPTKPGNGSVA